MRSRSRCQLMHGLGFVLACAGTAFLVVVLVSMAKLAFGGGLYGGRRVVSAEMLLGKAPPQWQPGDLIVGAVVGLAVAVVGGGLMQSGKAGLSRLARGEGTGSDDPLMRAVAGGRVGGVVLCERCKEPHRHGARYCPRCGVIL